MFLHCDFILALSKWMTGYTECYIAYKPDLYNKINECFENNT